MPPVSIGGLTKAELRLVECARLGEIWGPEVSPDFPWDHQDYSNNNPINAETWPDACRLRPGVIRSLITGARWNSEPNPWPLHPKGVLIANALIEGDLDLEGCELQRQLWLFSCQVCGRIMLQDTISKTIGFDGTRILRGTDPQPKTFPHAISARRLRVNGDMFMRQGFYADREVLLQYANISGSLDCEGGTFHLPSWIALNCAEITVGANVYLNHDFRAEGRTDFSRAKIAGSLHCNGGAFLSEKMGALLLPSARIGANLRLRRVAAMKGDLNLDQAEARTFLDDGTARPKSGNILLDGFTYRRICIENISARKCLKLLRCQPHNDLSRDFKPQPWIQLINVLREMGHDDLARKIAMKRETAMSQTRRGPLRWIWRMFLRFTIGYGYRPHWALIWSLIFVLLGGLTFYTADQLHYMSPRDGSVIVYMTVFKNAEHPPPYYNRFNPWVYALDVYLPVIELGQDKAWETSFPPRDRHNVSIFRTQIGAYRGRFRSACGILGSDFSRCVSAAIGAGLGEFLFSNGFHRFVYWCEEVLGWIFVSLYIAGMSGLMKKKE